MINYHQSEIRIPFEFHLLELLFRNMTEEIFSEQK